NKPLCSRSNRGCESSEKVGQALWGRGMKRCEQVFPVCWKVVEWTMGPKFSTPGSGKPLLNVEYYVEKVEFHIPFKIGRRRGSAAHVFDDVLHRFFQAAVVFQVLLHGFEG